MAMQDDMERERRATWVGFCKLMTVTAVSVAVTLLLMALFLT